MVVVSERKSVYISISKANFGNRFKAMSMATERGFVPLYPNIVADLAKVNKEVSKLSRDSERLDQIKKSAEVWVIGKVEGEMNEDIDLAKRFGKKIRYFQPSRPGAEMIEIEE